MPRELDANGKDGVCQSEISLASGAEYSISGTLESNSRTRRFSSSSSINRANGCERREPPNKRERLRTALLPQARHAGVVFAPINSHCTQKMAVGKERKCT